MDNDAAYAERLSIDRSWMLRRLRRHWNDQLL